MGGGARGAHRNYTQTHPSQHWAQYPKVQYLHAGPLVRVLEAVPSRSHNLWVGAGDAGVFQRNLGWLFHLAPDIHFNHSSLNMLSLHGHVLGLSACTSKFSAWYLDISILFKWPDLHYHCGGRKNPIMQ